jgi:transposase-like zinc-binding protein
LWAVRHCPKCQSMAAREWLAEGEAELLPVPYPCASALVHSRSGSHCTRKA